MIRRSAVLRLYTNLLRVLPALAAAWPAWLPASFADSWPMEGRSSERAYSTADRLAPPLALAWRVDLPDGEEVFGAALAGRTLCVISGYRDAEGAEPLLLLRAFDPLRGVERWRVEIGRGEAASPAISVERVFTAVVGASSLDAARKGILFARALSDGRLLWEADFSPPPADGPPFDPSPNPFLAPSHEPSSVLFHDGLLWLPGAGSRILRFDPSTGAGLEPLEAGLAGDSPGSSPLRHVGVSDAGWLAAAERDGLAGGPSGAVPWRIDLPGAHPLPPTLHGPIAFLPSIEEEGGEPSKLHAVEIETGMSLWSASSAMTAISVGGDGVATASADGNLRAYDPFTGAGRWISPGDAAAGGLVRVPGYLLQGDSGGRLRMLDAFTGREAWRYRTDAAAPGLPSRMLLLAAAGEEATGSARTTLVALRRDGLLLGFESGVYGDANGDGSVDTGDVTRVIRAAIGLIALEESARQAVDVSPSPGTGGRLLGDGAITVGDAVSILRRVVGL